MQGAASAASAIAQAVVTEANWTTHADWWVAISTGCLALITAALAFFTWKLWAATGNLVREAEDTSKRQLRAYVNISDAQHRLNEQGVAEVRVDFRNFGQTPAYRVSTWTRLEFGEPESPPDLSRPLHLVPQAKGALGPGASMHCYLESKGPIAAELSLELLTGGKALFVAGELRYFDCFNTERRTTYRLVAKRHGIKLGRFEDLDAGCEAT